MVKSKKSNTKARKNLKARVHKAVRPAKAKRPKPAIKHKGRSAPRNKTELRKHVKVVSIASKQKLAHGATTLPGKEKAAEGRKKVNVSIPQPEEVKEALDRLLTNERATEYLKKNVSKMAVDVVGMLVTPKTDEFLAEQIGIKINAIRRILNIMQGYGITNYYISKNTKGWLSFAWYINTNKLAPFLEYIDSMEKDKSIINDTCNDYFVCQSCYRSDKFIFTFDSAFESSFKCTNCGKGLSRMNKEEVSTLTNVKEPKAYNTVGPTEVKKPV
ncbi:TPA: hypothetical protein HA310_00070 [Candidatus Micrarchaeota archaeon]|jgi:transcription initiation factor IIE alpha subunit|nr:hypothetical protein [Candidatus Micrarchaeota archaeon]